MSDELCPGCTKKADCNTSELGVSSCWQYEPSFTIIRDHFEKLLSASNVNYQNEIMLRTTYKVKIERNVTLKDLRKITKALNATINYFNLKV